MSTPVEKLISECFDELRITQRFEPYILKAEEAGFPQLSKFFQAMVASETAREALFRNGIPHQASQTCDYYVCPHCGLIYDTDLPELCLVDQTPGVDFIVIH